MLVELEGGRRPRVGGQQEVDDEEEEEGGGGAEEARRLAGLNEVEAPGWDWS